MPGEDRHYDMIAEAPLTAVAIGTGKYIEYANGDSTDAKKEY